MKKWEKILISLYSLNKIKNDESVRWREEFLNSKNIVLNYLSPYADKMVKSVLTKEKHNGVECWVVDEIEIEGYKFHFNKRKVPFSKKHREITMF